MKKENEKITFDELKSFRYMFKQSPVFASVLVLANILILVAAGMAIFA